LVLGFGDGSILFVLFVGLDDGSLAFILVLVWFIFELVLFWGVFLELL
jgi:hypothetical protein